MTHTPDAAGLSASERLDAVAMLDALDAALAPFTDRPGGVNCASMLHALALMLASVAQQAGEPLDSLLDNVRLLYLQCSLASEKLS